MQSICLTRKLLSCCYMCKASSYGWFHSHTERTDSFLFSFPVTGMRQQSAGLIGGRKDDEPQALNGSIPSLSAPVVDDTNSKMARHDAHGQEVGFTGDGRKVASIGKEKQEVSFEHDMPATNSVSGQKLYGRRGEQFNALGNLMVPALQTNVSIAPAGRGLIAKKWTGSNPQILNLLNNRRCKTLTWKNSPLR